MAPHRYRLTFITTGEHELGTADPELLPVAHVVLKMLKDKFPRKQRKFPVIICGTGKRHLETAQALGLTPDRFSPYFGTAALIQERVVHFTSGLTDHASKFLLFDNDLRRIFRNLHPETVVIGDLAIINSIIASQVPGWDNPHQIIGFNSMVRFTIRLRELVKITVFTTFGLKEGQVIYSTDMPPAPVSKVGEGDCL